jgi:hypothetical protein
MLPSVARLVALVVVCSAVAGPAFAQDEPRFALVASFPSPTVSFQWEVNNRFAVRVEGGYSFRDESSEYELGGNESFFNGLPTPRSTSRLDSTSHGGFLGVAGIVTMRRTDRMRLYLAPRVLLSFSRQSITETVSSSPRTLEHVYSDGTSSRVIFGLGASDPTTAETSYTSPGAGASFGAASKVFDHVALFGEAGLTYSLSDTPAVGTTASLGSLASREVRRTTLNTRAVAGVMFLF